MPDSTTVPEFLRNAHQFLKAGDRKAARLLILAALQKEPENADAWYLAAVASDTPSRKLEAVRRALRIRPDHPQAIRMREKLEREQAATPAPPPAAPVPTPPTPSPAPPASSRPTRLPWEPSSSVTETPFVEGSKHTPGSAAGSARAVVTPISLSDADVDTLFAEDTKYAPDPAELSAADVDAIFNEAPPTAPYGRYEPATCSTPVFHTIEDVPPDDLTWRDRIDWRRLLRLGLYALLMIGVAIGTIILLATDNAQQAPLTSRELDGTRFAATGARPPRYTATPPAFPILSNPIHHLPFDVVDAAYSTALDRMIVVSTVPRALHIYNAETGQDLIVPLPRDPTCLSLAPDGRSAAVGHDALVSFVDLAAGQATGTFYVPNEVSDIALPGNGFIYVTGTSGTPGLTAVNTVTGTSEVIPQSPLDGEDILLFHPQARRLYIFNLSRAVVYGVYGTDGALTLLNSDLYRYPCGPVWLSHDGRRLYENCGRIRRVSEDVEQDLAEASRIDRSSLTLASVAEMPASGSVITIESPGSHTGLESHPGYMMRFYDYATLNLENTLILPDHYEGETPSPAMGRFVSVNADESRFYVVLHLLRNSTRYGLLKGSTDQLRGDSAPDGVDSREATPMPTPTPTPTLTPPVTLSEVTQFPFNVRDAELSTAQRRLIIVSADPSQLHMVDPVTNTDAVIALPRPPTSLAVSPDGKFAAVGHNTNIVSYVDLMRGTVYSLPMDGKVTDVILSGDGNLYVAGDVVVSLESVSPDVPGLETVFAVPGESIRLHPDGDRIYACYGRYDGRYYAVNRYNLVRGKPEPADPPWTRISGNDLWFSEDGNTVYTPLGVTLRSFADVTRDMAHNGYLNGEFIFVAQALQVGKILGLTRTRATLPDTGHELRVFDDEHLTFEGGMVLPEFIPGTASQGRFIFVDGRDFYVIVQAEEGSPILNNFGYLKGTFVD